MENTCGLLTAQREQVPLKSIEVELEVKDHMATVVTTLHYQNTEENPIEAVCVFPLPSDVAVCHFGAQIGETRIVGQLKEKGEAKERYDDALSSGHQAFFLQESDESPDTITLSVGNLPPGESASIRLEYITELVLQADEGLRFCLPAVLNPRYQLQGSEGSSKQMTSVPASPVQYSLSVCTRVSSSCPVSKVESNCCLDPLEYLNTEQTQAIVKLAAGHKFDRDVELLIYYRDAHQPAAVVEAGQVSAKAGTLMGDPVVMLTLYPEFPPFSVTSVAPQGEFVFLIDRSGSMDFSMDMVSDSKNKQTRICSAKDTLMLLLKSLPMGCYFNIYSFANTYEHIFPKSVKYSQKTLKEALKKVEGLKAGGGTKVFEPLKHIFSQRCIPHQPRQLFVFTDGEVGDIKEVLHLVRKNSLSHRCFPFGIGEGASSTLISGLAREGGGHAQFITGTERMQLKAMQSLQLALQPVAEDISVTWDLPKGVAVTLLSPPVTRLLWGQRSLILAQLTSQCPEAAEGCVTVKYSLSGHPIQTQVHFSLQPTEDPGLTIHRLAAWTLIRSLEMKETQVNGMKDKIVELSVQSGVRSAFTAFVVVNEDDGEPVQGAMLSRDMLFALCLREFCLSDYYDNDPCGHNPGIYMRKKVTSVFRRIGSFFKQSQANDSEHKQPPRDSLLQLVSLQEASGFWALDPALAAALGKTSEETANSKPSSVSKEVWATILALIWLHGFKSDMRVEWELLAMKAGLWLRAQDAPCLAECVEAGNALLGCEMETDALGI
ncbi:von Willebrand factor A domain-containing protein 5A-like [Aulostomus maculatus]